MRILCCIRFVFLQSIMPPWPTPKLYGCWDFYPSMGIDYYTAPDGFVLDARSGARASCCVCLRHIQGTGRVRAPLFDDDGTRKRRRWVQQPLVDLVGERFYLKHITCVEQEWLERELTSSDSDEDDRTPPDTDAEDPSSNPASGSAGERASASTSAGERASASTSAGAREGLV